MTETPSSPLDAPDFLAPEIVEEPVVQPPPSQSNLVESRPIQGSTTPFRLLGTLGVLLVIVIVIVAAQRVGWANFFSVCPKDTLCITAEKILRAYTNNFDAAQTTYAGQAVIVTGRLESAITNDTGNYSAVITPRSSSGGLGQPFLGCRDLSQLDLKSWRANHPNSWNVRVAGTVAHGGIIDNDIVFVSLSDCRLVH